MPHHFPTRMYLVILGNFSLPIGAYPMVLSLSIHQVFLFQLMLSKLIFLAQVFWFGPSKIISQCQSSYEKEKKGRRSYISMYWKRRQVWVVLVTKKTKVSSQQIQRNTDPYRETKVPSPQEVLEYSRDHFLTVVTNAHGFHQFQIQMGLDVLTGQEQQVLIRLLLQREAYPSWGNSQGGQKSTVLKDKMQRLSKCNKIL